MFHVKTVDNAPRGSRQLLHLVHCRLGGRVVLWESVELGSRLGRFEIEQSPGGRPRRRVGRRLETDQRDWVRDFARELVRSLLETLVGRVAREEVDLMVDESPMRGIENGPLRRVHGTPELDVEVI